ncbi:MAG: electron transfer flavoprotein subunit alpha/FixB family protein [Firmicutes bacterium]|nr:electron transfer flavoprotein subunit alpha/FixB family protein [Bacillota bacterium]
MREVWVYAESEAGRLHPVVDELMGEGRRLADRLGGSLGAVLLSPHDSLAGELALWADRVYVTPDPRLDRYTDERHSQLLARLIEAYRPEIVLIGGTRRGKSLAPRAAARVGTGLIADCTSLKLDEDGLLLAALPTFGGRLLATIVCPNHRPQMATLVPGAFASGPKGAGGKIINYPWADPEAGTVKVLEQKPLPVDDRPLKGAEIVIAGGRGMGSRENFVLLEEVARLLGAAVGASRGAVDAGWTGPGQLIGQTGAIVRPQLYIACGISGATQHVVGMQRAEVVVAVDKDPKAPIFDLATYGIVGDCREFLLELKRRLPAPCSADEENQGKND